MTVVFVHLSDKLINPLDPIRDYYAQAYSKMPGYVLPDDFFEIPTWIAVASGRLPDSQQELVISRSYGHYVQTLTENDVVMMSVTDASVPAVRRELAHIPRHTKVLLGGYVSEDVQKTLVDDHVQWLDSINYLREHFIEYDSYGHPCYELFRGMRCIPRLTMSSGCLHNCRFCTIPRRVIGRSTSNILNQIDSFEPLDYELIYLDDKTFGQALNWIHLDEIYGYIWSKRDFHGFTVQTTAVELLEHAGKFASMNVKYVEVGVESLDPSWLKWMRKPHSKKQILQATEAARAAGLKLIPNIMLCLPGKRYDAELAWLRNNRDIIPVVNIFKLCCYEDSKGKEGWFTPDPINRNEHTFERTWLSFEEITYNREVAERIMEMFK